MCCVIPPASPATTSVSRIASSSEVLPWSTWPMIVTTGGRGAELLSASSKTGLGRLVLGRADDLDLLVELVGEHADRLVGERLRDRRHLAQLHQLLDHVRDLQAEVLGDVADRGARGDPDRLGLDDRRRRFDSLGSGGGAPRPRLRRRRCCGGGCGAWRREACESITTRRRRPPPPPRRRTVAGPLGRGR